MKARGVGAALAVAAVMAAGCSSSGGGSASTASPAVSATASVALCADVAAVRASVSKLGHVAASPDALAKLKADVTEIKESLARLRTAAGAQWETQISDLNEALASLQKTLAGLGSQPSPAAAAKAVSADLARVTTAASELLRTASIRCPSASAAPSA